MTKEHLSLWLAAMRKSHSFSNPYELFFEAITGLPAPPEIERLQRTEYRSTKEIADWIEQNIKPTPTP